LRSLYGAIAPGLRRMIDIKKEMTIKVDHPVPYLVDLVGRLVKERDKAISVCVDIYFKFEEKQGGELSKSDIREWVEGQI